MTSYNKLFWLQKQKKLPTSQGCYGKVKNSYAHIWKGYANESAIQTSITVTN